MEHANGVNDNISRFFSLCLASSGDYLYFFVVKEKLILYDIRYKAKTLLLVQSNVKKQAKLFIHNDLFYPAYRQSDKQPLHNYVTRCICSAKFCFSSFCL